MAEMKSCSSECKAWEPTEITMKDLITVQKITLNKSIIWKRKAYKCITWERFFDNEIVEDILDYTKKKEWAYESVSYWKNLSKNWPFSKSK